MLNIAFLQHSIKLFCFFVDTKNHPVHQCRTNLSSKKVVKQSLKEGLEAGASGMFALVNAISTKSKVDELKNFYKIVGIETIDQLTFNEKTHQYYSEKGMQSFNLVRPITKVSEQDNSYDLSIMIDYYEEFLEFAPFYASNELVGKNVIDQNQEIKEKLKIGYQFLDREVFGFIGYDKNNEVMFVKELFKGGRNASVVDARILTKEILREDNLKGFAVFHNHPSGIPDQSEEDEIVTRRISKLSENLEVELLDHYIVGKRDVLSFADKVSWFESHNDDYQQKINSDRNQIAMPRFDVSREMG